MANEDDLKAATEAGLVDEAQAEKLKTFFAERAKPAPPPPQQVITGEEDLRFIRNFHDVFLATGIAILAVGVVLAITAVTRVWEIGGSWKESKPLLTAAMMSAGGAALFWGLGEFFARRRRLFLPAIAIVVCLAMFAAGAAAAFYLYVVFANGDLSALDPKKNAIDVTPLIASGAAALAAALFYLRFRLPFSLGLTGCLLALLLLSAVRLATPLADSWVKLIAGIALFAAALAFDMRDPQRQTRFSDNGFWLHVAAAPLLLGGIMDAVGVVGGGIGMLTRGRVGELISPGSGAGDQAAQAITVLIVVGALGFVSLLINRRALIVSALFTTGIAIGALLDAFGLGVSGLAAATLITLGCFVLILGASWHVARRALLGWVKPNGMLARAFPPEPLLSQPQL